MCIRMFYNNTLNGTKIKIAQLKRQDGGQYIEHTFFHLIQVSVLLLLFGTCLKL